MCLDKRFSDLELVAMERADGRGRGEPDDGGV
jgi:hypothetical protein